jgi:hypothetical protein
MMRCKVLGAAALSMALAVAPALARDGHGGGGGRGGGGGMSHGATLGGSGARSAAIGGSFRGAAAGGGSSFRGGSQVSRSGNQFARGGNFRGHRRGGFGFGVAAGAALGGYYGYDNDYYDNAYYGDGYGPAYAYEGGDDSSGYCSQRYRSYDPSTGTYMGYDRQPHPCS